MYRFISLYHSLVLPGLKSNLRFTGLMKKRKRLAVLLPKQLLSELHLLAGGECEFSKLNSHMNRQFILFVCSTWQIQWGEGISESSRERGFFCDFIIDLAIYVTPRSGGITFILFVLSLSDAASLFFRGRADGLICREVEGRELNAKSHSC